MYISMGELTSAGWITRGLQTGVLHSVDWLELRGQIAMMDLEIDVQELVKATGHELRIKLTGIFLTAGRHHMTSIKLAV